MLQSIPHPGLASGAVRLAGFPVKLSATPAERPPPPAAAGRAHREILAELGYGSRRGRRVHHHQASRANCAAARYRRSVRPAADPRQLGHLRLDRRRRRRAQRGGLHARLRRRAPDQPRPRQRLRPDDGRRRQPGASAMGVTAAAPLLIACSALCCCVWRARSPAALLNVGRRAPRLPAISRRPRPAGPLVASVALSFVLFRPPSGGTTFVSSRRPARTRASTCRCWRCPTWSRDRAGRRRRVVHAQGPARPGHRGGWSRCGGVGAAGAHPHRAGCCAPSQQDPEMTVADGRRPGPRPADRVRRRRRAWPASARRSSPRTSAAPTPSTDCAAGWRR